MSKILTKSTPNAETLLVSLTRGSEIYLVQQLKINFYLDLISNGIGENSHCITGDIGIGIKGWSSDEFTNCSYNGIKPDFDNVQGN